MSGIFDKAQEGIKKMSAVPKGKIRAPSGRVYDRPTTAEGWAELEAAEARLSGATASGSTSKPVSAGVGKRANTERTVTRESRAADEQSRKTQDAVHGFAPVKAAADFLDKLMYPTSDRSKKEGGDFFNPKKPPAGDDQNNPVSFLVGGAASVYDDATNQIPADARIAMAPDSTLKERAGAVTNVALRTLNVAASVVPSLAVGMKMGTKGVNTLIRAAKNGDMRAFQKIERALSQLPEYQKSANVVDTPKPRSLAEIVAKHENVGVTESVTPPRVEMPPPAAIPEGLGGPGLQQGPKPVGMPPPVAIGEGLGGPGHVQGPPQSLAEIVAKHEGTAAVADDLPTPTKAEDPLPISESTGTAAANDSAADVRQAMDLPPVAEPVPETFEGWASNPKTKAAGEDWKRITAEVSDGKKLDKHETIGLAGKLDEMDQQYNRLTKEIDDARNAGDFDKVKAITAQRDGLKAEAMEISDALKQSGTEQARAFAARKAIVRDDYSLAGIIREAEGTAGRTLRPKEQRAFEAVSKQLEEAETKLAEAEAALAKRSADDSIKTRKAPAMKREELDAELETLLKDFSASAAKVSSGIIGKIAVNRVKYGAASIEEMVASVKQVFKDRGLAEPSDDDIIKAYNDQRPRRTAAEVSDEIKAKRAALAKLNREAEDIATGKAAEREAGISQKKQRALDREAQRKMTAEQRAADAEAKRLANEEQKQALGARKPYEVEQATRERLTSEIADLEKQLETGDIAPPKGKAERVRSREVERLMFERDKVRARLRDRVKALQPSFWNTPIGKTLKESSALIRGLSLGSDIGVLLRQGGFGLVNHPVGYSKALVKGLKAARSETDLAAVLREIAERKIAGKDMDMIRKRAGLSLTDSVQVAEEGFQSRVLKLIPGQKNLEQFQSGFINHLRAAMFDDFFAANPDAPMAQLKERARFINAALGRSNLGKVSEGLNTAMTSARWTVSRWEMVGRGIASPATAVRAIKNPAARQELKDLGRYAASLYGVYKAAEAAGAEIEFDPVSSDFLKIRIGETVYDPTSGMAGPVRLALRTVWMAFGQMEVNARSNIGSELGKQLSYTAAPIVRNALTQIPGAGLTGFKLEDHEKGWWSVAPLIVSGAVETYKKEGAGSAAVRAGTEALGVNSQRYPKRDASSDQSRPSRPRRLIPPE